MLRTRILALSLLLCASFLTIPASAVNAAPGDNYVVDDALTSSRTQWWNEARFGMFIHWGVYSAFKGVYGTCRDAEWIKRTCNVPDSAYVAKAATWNPAAYDANKIVQLAKQAGQKYIVITGKHHDGFAMWPTKVNDWNIRDRTPFQRDPLRELADAARANGIKFGLYYSIWDWHDPDFSTNFPAYLNRAKAQLQELVTAYDPDILWFDGEWSDTNPTNPFTAQDGEQLEAYVRGLSPDIVVNNRVIKRRPVDGDTGTPEQELPSGPPTAQLQESCMTINGTWGYAEWDTSYKSPTQLTRNLVYLTSNGSNYLLNIGPTDTGDITAGQVSALQGVGAWLAANNAAIYGAGYTGLVAQPGWGRIIRKGDKLYLAVHTWPSAGSPLHVTARSPFTVTGARVLGSGQSVAVQAAGDGYDIAPSGAATNSIATVIEVDISVPAAAPVGTGTGLKAEFWNNTTFSGTPVVTRTDPTVNYAWRFSGSPAASILADNFSSRWTGQLQPRHSEQYTFTTASDDTTRLWVNGQLLIDKTTPHAPQVDQGTISLTAGQHYDIRLEQTENSGEAYMKLIWSSPNTPAQIIPATQLYPASSGGPVNNGDYTLTAVHSNKVADVSGGSTADGAAIIQWPASGAANQRWRTADAGGGTFTLVSMSSGKCMDVADASAGSGAAVIQWACHGGDNQKWRFTEAGGTWQIAAVHSDLCLTVPSASTANGVQLQQAACGSQKWTLA